MCVGVRVTVSVTVVRRDPVSLSLSSPFRMSSRAAVTDTRLLDELVLQHLKERGFAEVAASLEAELAKQKKPRGKAASALVADNTRPALVQLLISTMRLHESYEALRDWVDGSLEAFRPELRRLLFPMFVHCYLELVEASNLEEAAQFLSEGQEDHALFHQAELNLLSQVSAPSHVAAHEFAKRVRSRRFARPSLDQRLSNVGNPVSCSRWVSSVKAMRFCRYSAKRYADEETATITTRRRAKRVAACRCRYPMSPEIAWMTSVVKSCSVVP